MRILDRYVVFKYLQMLLWSITAATIVFLVLDVENYLDKFIDSRVPLTTVICYYYLYVPYVVYLILPVATLLATLFTIGGLTITNELSAMQISGIPFIRPLILLLLVASAVAAGGFYIGETIVPEFNRERMDIYRYDVRKLPRETRSKHGKLYMQLGMNRQLQIDRYSPATREAYGIQLVEVQAGRISRRTDAERMVWRDAAWHLQGAVERKFDESGLISWERDSDISVSGDGLRPDELEKVQTKPEEMNWVELKEFVKRLSSSGGNTIRWQVDLFFKVSLPVAAIIIVLFGAPIASVRRRGGTALGFGLALFICFIYFGFIQIGRVLGYNGTLPPIISAWAGNFFFGILGLGILFRSTR
ncbi:YjgP/YjgQ family permease [bacterium]|nr:YjgP/YjgQ family permease [bacterium]